MNKGFTLLEMLVAMAVGGIIIFGISEFFATQDRHHKRLSVKRQVAEFKDQLKDQISRTINTAMLDNTGTPYFATYHEDGTSACGLDCPQLSISSETYALYKAQNKKESAVFFFKQTDIKNECIDSRRLGKMHSTSIFQQTTTCFKCPNGTIPVINFDNWMPTPPDPEARAVNSYMYKDAATLKSLISVTDFKSDLRKIYYPTYYNIVNESSNDTGEQVESYKAFNVLEGASVCFQVKGSKATKQWKVVVDLSIYHDSHIREDNMPIIKEKRLRFDVPISRGNVRALSR